MKDLSKLAEEKLKDEFLEYSSMELYPRQKELVINAMIAMYEAGWKDRGEADIKAISDDFEFNQFDITTTHKCLNAIKSNTK